MATISKKSVLEFLIFEALGLNTALAVCALVYEILTLFSMPKVISTGFSTAHGQPWAGLEAAKHPTMVYCCNLPPLQGGYHRVLEAAKTPPHIRHLSKQKWPTTAN